MDAELSGDVFWVLLTLTALPPEEAMGHFKLNTPTRDDPWPIPQSKNPLSQLSRTFIEFYSGWFDSFTPNCKSAEDLVALCWEMGQESSISPPGPFCREEFINGDGWKKARKLARAALDEVEMEPWPLTEKIDFSEYIEIVS